MMIEAGCADLQNLKPNASLRCSGLQRAELRSFEAWVGDPTLWQTNSLTLGQALHSSSLSVLISGMTVKCFLTKILGSIKIHTGLF